MKFENRLEATRWMVENPNKLVHFNITGEPARFRYPVWIDDGGCLLGRVEYFNGTIANIRTADHKEPEVGIDWRYVIEGRPDSNSQFLIEHGAPLTQEMLIRFSLSLEKALDSKFEAKK